MYVYKVLILEANTSKKSAFLDGLYRSCEGKDFGDVGIVIKSVKTPFNTEESYTLQLWVLKYNTTIKKVYPQFCQGASCVLIFFDDTIGNSLPDTKDLIEETIKYAGNIPIILVETESAFKNDRISTEETDNTMDCFRFNRLYFKYFNDNTREKVFRQVIQIIKERLKSNCFKVFLSNEWNDFKKFDRLFSVYQVC